MRRTAVIDLGSNSFRLVVYDWEPGGPWALSDEIREPVRISAGMGDERALRPDAIERALAATEVFAAFCRAAGIEDVLPVATSAIRDARNRDRVLAAIRERSGLEVRVLTGAEEAYYGYLAVVNSTTLADGLAIDMGGGSIQLMRVDDRALGEAESLPLGAVRVSERFLPGERASAREIGALRDHVGAAVGALGWWRDGRRLAGIGGGIRNLASAAQRRGGYPGHGVGGFTLTAPMLDELTDELASRPASKRGKVPGIKPDRGDVILGTAVVLSAVMEAGGLDAVEVSEAGLREGVFLSRFLHGAERAVLADVRAQSVANLARRFNAAGPHAHHVERLALELYDGLAAADLITGARADRELLARASVLHDIGMAIDYDDHHKHSRYLIESAGLPGYTQRELELIALIARYHRKGEPDAGPLGPLAEEGDERRLALLSGIVRVAEQLERSRDGSVRSVSVTAEAEAVAIRATGADNAVAIWSARRAAGLLESALGRPVEVRPA